MSNTFRKLFKNEEGITALETAIILIAFVVVASVFAFTILSAGTFTTERGKEAVYAGLSEVRGTMELKGSVVAEGLPGTVVSKVQFTVSTVAGGEPIDLTLGTGQKIVVDYRDATHVEDSVGISISFPVGDSDSLLEEGELAKIIVPLNGADAGISGVVGTPIDVNVPASKQFSLEIKPPNGAVILLERTLPAYIDAVMDLH